MTKGRRESTGSANEKVPLAARIFRRYTSPLPGVQHTPRPSKAWSYYKDKRQSNFQVDYNQVPVFRKADDWDVPEATKQFNEMIRILSIEEEKLLVTQSQISDQISRLQVEEVVLAKLLETATAQAEPSENPQPGLDEPC